jgi:Ca2+-transporting ATPase
MNFYDQTSEQVVINLGSNAVEGHSLISLKSNADKFGYNTLTQKKKRSIISKIADALKEPMLIILLFGFMITFGANLGKQLKNGNYLVALLDMKNLKANL